MGVDKPDNKTVFGAEFKVVVYPVDYQYKGHISILANPEDAKQIKQLLQND